MSVHEAWSLVCRLFSAGTPVLQAARSVAELRACETLGAAIKPTVVNRRFALCPYCQLRNGQIFSADEGDIRATRHWSIVSSMWAAQSEVYQAHRHHPQARMCRYRKYAAGRHSPIVADVWRPAHTCPANFPNSGCSGLGSRPELLCQALPTMALMS